ncbi:NADH-quinone oxidoreductase subunit L [Pseudodesulfovibrio tunisiensis]|uniref:NADH-quinone oxidoreductase subunit 5 family protein n=1 Tax=Pseudodesulfovibrio tunisiensis TaxID=463192 RepID=UPI001FB375D0|nr:proton-conducting transporter membrane subunit [Pseudodesulfovibrio tunisiensis]
MSNLLLLLILLPVAAALVCYFVRSRAVRSLTVTATGAILTVASLGLLAQGEFTYSPGSFLGIMSWDVLITVLDFALLVIMFFYGLKLKNLLIQIFVAAQFVLLLWLEATIDHGMEIPALYGDNLSLIMVAIISIVGSLICIFAIPYMKEHEEHLHLTKSKQPRFFFFLVLFLGAMNGLVLANNILWLYFFFEVTTFCSFMLIGHDETEIATRNATRALWMNSLGGLAFVIGMILMEAKLGTVSIQAILAAGPQGAIMLTGLGFICLAGFTKAAQMPFQSWLLGAMVAPTPVSALLHSSTMVKAGVYVILRFAPAYAGTFLSYGIALCGAFTFVACAALAIGQSNGKKILAYSTISNLGLIIACAGINTPLAITAAIMLIIFHAVSKSLLFLCVGTIEHGIGSRDVEDMRGLYARMPRTTVITIVGILTMLLPPFGVLMSKWMAIEAASQFLIPVVLMAMGSALTVVYWARWGGLLMGTRERGAQPESQATLTRLPLTILVIGSVVLALIAPVIYSGLIAPLFPEGAPFQVSLGVLSSTQGGFAVYPLFLVLGVGLLFALKATSGWRKAKEVAPYVSGSNVETPGSYNGPMDQPVSFSAGNMYLGELFGENKITAAANAVAIALIVLMMGGAL